MSFARNTREYKSINCVDASACGGVFVKFKKKSDVALIRQQVLIFAHPMWKSLK